MSHKHSPTPFGSDRTIGDILDCNGVPICAVLPRMRDRDLPFIVEACNSYDRMRAALENIRDNFDHEHHSKGQVAKGECDGAPQCRACEAAEELGDK